MKRKERKVGIIPGDGIGPEVTLAARRCMDSAFGGLGWEKVSVGHESFGQEGTPLAPSAVKALMRLRLALKGPLEGSYAGVSYNPNVVLKELLGIHASVRRCRSFSGATGGGTGIDMLVIKQERHDWPRDFEMDSEHPAWANLLDHQAGKTKNAWQMRGTAAVRYVCPGQARQFFEFAMKYAADLGRKRVTAAHRASSMKKTDGLWLREGEEVARRFGTIEFEDQLVDHVVLQMARNPQRFDVILCAEPYADIIGDLAVGLCGGLGMVPLALFGVHGAAFTSVHGTAPKYAGLDRANPCAMILAGAEMLTFLGQKRAGKRIEDGVARALADGAKTADMAGDEESPLGTAAFAETVIGAMEKGRLAGTGDRKSGLA